MTEQEIKEAFERNGVQFVNRSYGLCTTKNIAFQTLMQIVRELTAKSAESAEIEWLRKKAEIEDKSIVSVGGLVQKLENPTEICPTCKARHLDESGWCPKCGTRRIYEV